MVKDLTYNTNMVRNLTELLNSKDEHISELKQENDGLKQENQAQKEQSDAMQANLQTTLDELLDAKQEVKRLSNAYEQQSEQLTEANRIVRVQESRLASIKSLAQSLSFNIESWALDDQQKEGEAEHWGGNNNNNNNNQRQQSSQPRPSQPEPNQNQEQQLQQDHHHHQMQTTSHTDQDHHDSRFEVLEGMETIRHHGNHPLTQRVSPNKTTTEDNSLKTNSNEDYSFKTIETGLSTRPEDGTLPPSPSSQDETPMGAISMRQEEEEVS